MIAAVVGMGAALAFVLVERRRTNPMLPLGIFSSRQFTVANAITFVVYGALGGVFFLLVVFLQTALGYSPLQSGAASLPITAVMLALSSRAGALAQRIGPRRPLTVGPILIAAGMLLMLRIEPGSSYLVDVLPAVLVFGLGLAGTVAPVTATVLAAAEERHAGVASGVNNAVARTAQLAAIAVLPLAVGLSGDDYTDPAAFTDAFHLAMVLTAGLAACGGALAWFAISDDVLHETPPVGEEKPPAPVATVHHHLHCGVAGPPPRERSPSRTR
jgi:Na+/melibiose symporter-like transporter